MFNRQEQVAVLFLSGSLLVGTGIALVERHDPAALEEFHVIKGAVEVPPAQESAAAVEDPSAHPDAADSADGSSPAVASAVAVNRATLSQLQTLPSVGPRTAARIVLYRDSNGPFRTLDELVKVKGIGSATLEKLRPFATLN